MLINKLWRTLWQYKAQFIAMIIMIAFGVGIFNGFNMEWVSLQDDIDRFFEESNYPDYMVYIESDDSTADEDKIFLDTDQDSMFYSDFVTDVTRALTIETAVAEREGDHLATVVSEDLEVAGFILEEGEPFDSRSEDGVWLSSKYAEMNGFALGDPITLTYGEYTMEGRVAGLICAATYLVCYRDLNQTMPDYETFGYTYISPKLVANALGSNYFYNQVNVHSNLDKTTFRQRMAELFPTKNLMIIAKADTDAYAEAKIQIEQAQTMSGVLPILFFVIAVLTMISTMNRLTVKEKLQIGTLKALGFKNRQIINHYMFYSIAIGILGIIPGMGIGYAIAAYLFSKGGSLATYFNMPYWDITISPTCVVIMVLLLILFASVGAFSVKRILRGSAATVLRPYVPKNMKPLLIEKLPIFKKAKFGTRWNLRDIFKNKLRTLMSLIGIIGCMMMLVSAVGLRDTMQDFADVYYEGALGYNSRIVLNDDVEKDAGHKLAEKYGNNYSSTISLEVDKDVAVVEIYNLEEISGRKMVQFISDVDGSFMDLPEQGAYISARLSESFGVGPGDKITVYAYGKKDPYDIEIVGVMRSVSLAFSMTTEYAQSIGFEDYVDVIYTDLDIPAIEFDPAIKSIQNKVEIMNSFDSFMQIIYTMIAILLLTSIILGVTVLYNLGVMSYTERYKDMATLKVLGFKNKTIAGILVNQNVWLSILGVILGFPAGYYILDYLVYELGQDFEVATSIGPATIIVSFCVTLGVSLLVALFIARKNKDIDMVEAMKGQE